MIVSVRKVSKHYPLGEKEVPALREVSLDVAAGEFLAIVGPSGSGKTTLLNLIGCLDLPDQGQVVVDGKETASLDDDAASRFRNQVLGFIFQHYNLIPVLNVYENVEYPVLLRGGTVSLDKQAEIRDLISQVGLGDYLHHRPDQLSGGQRQRVAIARALVNEPRLVVADEPTGNLDHETSEAVIGIMKDLNQRLGTTFIFSTHDPRVMAHAARCVELVDGQVAEAGPQ